MRETTTALTELRISLQYTQTQVEEMKVNQSKETSTTCQKRCSISKTRYRKWNARSTTKKINRDAAFCGLTAFLKSTWEQTEKNVRRAMTTALELPEAQLHVINIERAHRTGGTGTRARTIVVKFKSYKDRELVLQAAKKNRPRGIYVNEDYSQRVMAWRKELLPKMTKAREEGKIAYLTFDKLVVGERHDVANRD